MALLPVTHKPTAAQARQFDGSLEAFLDILSARPKQGVSVQLGFADDGSFTLMTMSGGAVGNVSLNLTDWAIFPTDINEPAFSLTNAQALARWQG